MDAGYTVESVMDTLTNENLQFIGRLKTNAKLEELAAPHLVRPVGCPPAKGCEFCVELGMYQADSWKHPQRWILVFIDHPELAAGQLNLMHRHFSWLQT